MLIMISENILSSKTPTGENSFFVRTRIFFSQVFSVLLMTLIVFSESAWDSASHLLSAGLFLSGVVLVGIASLGRLWCSLYIAGYKTDRLITVGPYSITRNPLYFFSMLGGIGVGLATETVLIPSIILLAFSVYYPLVVKKEEIQLRRLHGTAYERYLKETPVFFPDISKLNEPGEYKAKPVIFRKHMLSAVWFVWLFGLLNAVESLRETGILPGIIELY